MRPDQAEKWLSEPRYAHFLAARGQDHDRAIELYKWNVEVSAAFFELLHHLEVLMRNAVDQQFPATPINHAITQVPTSDFWLTDPAILSPKAIDIVSEAASRLNQEGDPLTRGHLIAQQSFGFWQNLFRPHYNLLWASTLKHAFPNGNGKRSQVAGLLEKIRQFRNRLAHHEPVFDGGLASQHLRILRVAHLIDHDASVYIDHNSRAQALLAAEPT